MHENSATDNAISQRVGLFLNGIITVIAVTISVAS
jgi:hypothetical protein